MGTLFFGRFDNRWQPASDDRMHNATKLSSGFRKKHLKEKDLDSAQYPTLPEGIPDHILRNIRISSSSCNPPVELQPYKFWKYNTICKRMVQYVFPARADNIKICRHNGRHIFKTGFVKVRITYLYYLFR